MTRGCLPPRPSKLTLPQKRRTDFKEGQHFRRAAFLSASISQQHTSAAFRLSSSQQPFSTAFSAAFLNSSSQQPFSTAFSAAFLSSSSQQPFSAALLSSFSQQLFSAALLSSSSQQTLSAAFLSSLCEQLFSTAILSYHLAVVRGWWSAIDIILRWSGVGGSAI